MLTPEQRIEAYTYVMLFITEDITYKGYGVCLILDDWASLEGIDERWWQRRLLFPEFYSHEPDGGGLISWWPETTEGNLTRLSVLSSCIEEVEREMKANKSS